MADLTDLDKQEIMKATAIVLDEQPSKCMLVSAVLTKIRSKFDLPDPAIRGVIFKLNKLAISRGFFTVTEDNPRTICLKDNTTGAKAIAAASQGQIADLAAFHNANIQKALKKANSAVETLEEALEAVKGLRELAETYANQAEQDLKKARDVVNS